MAKIEKMQIMGIRSYSPEHGVVVEFPAPLTLIVGQNGCGKTTIIESLSYVISGNLPPGCRTASSFINDPKVCGETTVKGQVKLQFRDITGQQLTTTRSCTSIQKAKTMQSKAIDGTITKRVNGKEISISSRCADLTKEMISRLGVSKAVLDWVIFCHQENANWPLGEGKALKEKFDAIFAATRYIKALESIRNLRKEQGHDVKVYEGELAHLTSIKDKASEIKKDMSKAETQVLVSKEEIKKLSNEAQPIQEQLEELDKVSGEIIEIETNIATMQSSKKELEKTIRELDQNINDRFQGSLEELRTKQSEYDSTLNEKEMDLRDLKTVVRRLDIELSSLEERKSKLIQEQGRLEQETKAHKILIRERDELINVLAKDLDISGYRANSYEHHEADSFIGKMKEDFARIVTEGKKSGDEYTEQVKQLDVTIKKYEKSLISYQSTIEQKQKIIRGNSQKISDLSNQLGSLAGSESRIQNLESQLLQKESELSEFKSECNSHKLDEEIKTLFRDKKTEESVLVQLKEEENVMLQQSEAQTKITMMESDKAAKKDNFDNILRGRQELLESIFDTRPPVDELKSELSAFLKKCNSEIRKQTDEFQSSNTKLTQLESQRSILLIDGSSTMLTVYFLLAIGLYQLIGLDAKCNDVTTHFTKFEPDNNAIYLDRHRMICPRGRALQGFHLQRNPPKFGKISEEQRKKEDKFTESKGRIHAVCEENNYNEFREQVHKRVQAFNNNLSEINAFEKIYQKYMKQLREKGQDDGCPLCHRDFNNQRDIRNLIEELKIKMDTVPEKRENFEKSLLEEKKLEESILDLASEKNTVDVLNEEIPQLKKKISQLNQEIKEEKERLDKIKTSKSCVEQKEKNARSMEADISKIDDYLFDLKDLDRNITLEKSKIKGVADGRTMQSVRSDVQEKEVVMASLTRKIDQKRDQHMEQQRILSDLEREYNNLNSKMLSLKSELQKRTQIEHQKAELTSTNQSYEREIREASSQLQPIKEQLRKTNEEKRDLEMVLETHKNDIKDKLNKIKTEGDKIRKMIEKIKNFINEGRDTALEDNQDQMRTLEQRKKSKLDEKRSKEKEGNRIGDEVNKQSILKRELDDNVKLMEKEKEIKNIESKMEKLRRDLHQYGNFQGFRKDRGALQDKLDGFRKKKAELAGRLQGFEAEVERCERDLLSAMYADADLRHCQKVIDMKTTDLANQDLEKYYKALDNAVMRYHSLKLADINKIIKEYWVKTYRGGDIDTIEIIAESDGEGSGAVKSRRSYNYRVVMVKGATSLDMRGRCSAGQKVLASLIIRLALAETFCLNCGILALDEPTTNLDEQNVTSLAHSLRDIIEHRRAQKNFQLVIITHDEDFVQAIGRSDFVEHYFSVYKDENQNSRCKKKSFRDLHEEESQTL